jgi:hypothetical protein
VATENRIRAGADAAMGYFRFGMLDLLKLPSGLLVGLFRSHAAREAERAFRLCQVYVLGTRSSCIGYTDLQGFEPLIPA